MSHIVFGLDLGIASVGWGVIDTDKEKILGSGVRTFPPGETRAGSSMGKSLAAKRRESRSSRKTTKRRRVRQQDIKALFVATGLITQANISANKKIKSDLMPDTHLFHPLNTKECVWQLRKEALYRPVSSYEWMRILLHVASRRGRVVEFAESGSAKDNDEDKITSAAISKNQERLKNSGAQTVGEMFATHPDFADCKKNTTGNYIASISRADTENEIDTLFNKQREFGNKAIEEITSSGFQERYKAVALRQLHYDQNNLIQRMRGDCELEKNKKRAPKHSHAAELFVAKSILANLVICDQHGVERRLSDDEIEAALGQLFRTKGIKARTLKYNQARKYFNLSDDEVFKSIKKADEGKKVLIKASGFGILCAVFFKAETNANIAEGKASELMRDHRFIDRLATILTNFKEPNNRLKRIEKLDQIQALNKMPGYQDLVEELVGLSEFTGFINLSLDAVRKITPHLSADCTYVTAISKVYGDNVHRQVGKLHKMLPLLDGNLTTNPVVHRALTQARKVVNAMVRKFGSPDAVHLELSRDMGKSYSERQEIAKSQDKNRKVNEAIRKKIAEQYKVAPSNKALERYKLFEQQNGHCPYSGAKIEQDLLFSDNYEIDYILPWSRSFINGLKNKVLVTTAENQNKGNKTPFEYLEIDEWRAFEKRIDGMAHIPFEKKQRLLNTTFTDTSDDFLSRNLNDTRYICREFSNFVRKNLAGSDNSPVKVQVMNGIITSQLRHAWRVGTKDWTHDKHNAEDALIVAATKLSTIQMISRLARKNPKEKELVDKETGEVLATRKKGSFYKIAPPWETFSEDVTTSLEDVWSSIMVTQKIGGALHQDTVSSIKSPGKRVPVPTPGSLFKEDKVLGKKKAKATDESEQPIKMILKEKEFNEWHKQLAKLKDREGRNKPLYEALIGYFNKDIRYDQPPFKFNGIAVKHIKTEVKNPTTGVVIREGSANNGNVKRLDVYTFSDSEGRKRYWLSPVYAIHANKPKERALEHSINKARTSDLKKIAHLKHADSEQSCPYDLSKITFKASLFKGEKIRITKASEDGSTSANTLSAHFNSAKPGAISIALENIDMVKKQSTPLAQKLVADIEHQRKNTMNVNVFVRDTMEITDLKIVKQDMLGDETVLDI